jgi:hypothetical protein
LLRDREEGRLRVLRQSASGGRAPKHTELFPFRIRHHHPGGVVRLADIDLSVLRSINPIDLSTLFLWSQIEVQSVPHRLPMGSDEQDVAGHIRGGTSLRRLSAALVLALEVMMQPNACEQKRANSSLVGVDHDAVDHDASNPDLHVSRLTAAPVLR